MKFDSGRRSAAAASRNSSYTSFSNRKVTVLAMFPLPLAISVPPDNGTGIKPSTTIITSSIPLGTFLRVSEPVVFYARKAIVNSVFLRTARGLTT